jgi:dihydroxyacetone kinase-like protein
MSEQKQQLLDLLQVVGDKVIAAERILNELDAAVGDGDCGVSLRKGWQAALGRLPSLQCKSMGETLEQLARVFMSTVGGVSGAIYATAFLRAAKKIGEKEQLDLPEVHEVLVTALEGIRERGEGTKVGDKTMVDALEPAVQAFGQACHEGQSAGSVLEKALTAARRGSDGTIPLMAKKGRASYLGERSIGHRDAGSVVICLMFEAACDFQKGGG